MYIRGRERKLTTNKNNNKNDLRTQIDVKYFIFSNDYDVFLLNSLPLEEIVVDYSHIFRQ